VTDFSRPWPFGIGTKSWWLTALGCAVALVLAAAVDAPVSVWAQSWPAPIESFMALVTNLGLADWILIPSAILFAVTAGLALLVRWRLMRTMLWQFSALYAFIFLGVGLPGLIGTLLKRVIGRARPVHFADSGVFALRPNLLDWSYQGFPSVHTTTIFATALVTAFVWPRLSYPAIAIAIVVAVSRVAVGAHYPSDAVGGAILGVLGAYAVRWYFARRGWLFEAGPADRIHPRPPAAIKRYVSLKRRDIALAPWPDRT
jgi:membrane-associated phospholipid phosphatase